MAAPSSMEKCLEAGVLITLLWVELWSCLLLIFAWDLSGKKVLFSWDTFSLSTFTNFSEELREAFSPLDIEPKVGASNEDYSIFQ